MRGRFMGEQSPIPIQVNPCVNPFYMGLSATQIVPDKLPDRTEEHIPGISAYEYYYEEDGIYTVHIVQGVIKSIEISNRLSLVTLKVDGLTQLISWEHREAPKYIQELK